MKKAIFLAIAVMITGVFTVNAQGGGGGGFQRRTVEENVKMIKEKLADLKLDKDQTTKADSAFTEYYRSRDKMMEEMRASGGGGGDRTAMRDKFQKLGTDRDEKLKKVFTEAQFKKWKEEIEPSLRQRRGGGGGQGGGNN